MDGQPAMMDGWPAGYDGWMATIHDGWMETTQKRGRSRGRGPRFGAQRRVPDPGRGARAPFLLPSTHLTVPKNSNTVPKNLKYRSKNYQIPFQKISKGRASCVVGRWDDFRNISLCFPTGVGKPFLKSEITPQSSSPH